MSEVWNSAKCSELGISCLSQSPEKERPKDMTSTYSSSTHDTVEALELLKSMYLTKIVRIEIADGRVLEGEFQCMDKDMNFILGHATEYYGTRSIEFNKDDRESVHNCRILGMVMIPGKYISRCVALPWLICALERVMHGDWRHLHDHCERCIEPRGLYRVLWRATDYWIVHPVVFSKYWEHQ